MLQHDLEKAITSLKLDALIVEDTDDYYDHLTFSIHTLSEYIQLIEAIMMVQKTSSHNLKCVYRGMADRKWELVSSLQRIMTNRTKAFSLEHNLAVDFFLKLQIFFKTQAVTLKSFQRCSTMGFRRAY